jgi:hypothetical protein
MTAEAIPTPPINRRPTSTRDWSRNVADPWRGTRVEPPNWRGRWLDADQDKGRADLGILRA